MDTPVASSYSTGMRLSDHLADVRRDAEFQWTGPSDGQGRGLLAFASTPAHLRKALANSDLAALVVPGSLADLPAGASPSGIGLAVSARPREDFFAVHNHLAALADDALPPPEIDPSARVHPSAQLADGVRVAAGAEVAAGAILGPGTEIEDGAFVGEGAFVGVAGHFEQFGVDGRRMRVRHAGWVQVGPGAQILPGAIVQRDVYAIRTRIEEDAVIGPGVLLGHGATVGRRAVLAGGTVVAGYTRIGDDAWCGPGVTLGNRLEIGRGARAEIGAVVIRDLAPSARVSGNFARDHVANLRRQTKENSDD